MMIEAPSQLQATPPDVRGALSALCRENRAVLVLRECHGFGYDQIAKALGIPRLAVVDRIAAARKELLGQVC